MHEPADTYLAGWKAADMEDVKNKQIKVASSIHVKQTAWHGGSLYYPERPKISMEGKWLEKAGFLLENSFRWSIRKMPSAYIQQPEN